MIFIHAFFLKRAIHGHVVYRSRANVALCDECLDCDSFAAGSAVCDFVVILIFDDIFFFLLEI